MSNTAIQVSQLSKQFGEKIALHPISFSVEQGEVFGIIGMNGAGKSTLLKLLCGVMQPDSGEIIHYKPFTSILEVGAGFIPEFSGAANVRLLIKSAGLKGEQAKAIENEIWQFSELDSTSNLAVKFYSGGMYLRLAFASAIALAADTILIDEIISVGDEAFQRKCIAKIKSLSKLGKTFVLASHDLQSVNGICGRTLLLDHGQLVALKSTAELVRHYIEKTAFSGQLKSKNRLELNLPKVGVYINDIELLPQLPSTDDEIKLSMTFNFKGEVMPLFSFILFDQFNAPVLPISSALALQNELLTHGHGHYVLEVTVPSFFLNAGMFTLNLHVDTATEKIAEVEHVLLIKVERGEVQRKLIEQSGGDAFNGPIFYKMPTRILKLEN